MSEFTPTIEQIEDGYAHDPESEYRDPVNYGSIVAANRRAFRRALEAHDREVTAKALMDAAVQIPEQMRMDELGLHLLDYTHQLPESSRVMLNGATRFAERLVMRADALESLSTPPATDDALPERLEAQATFVPETRMADVMREAAEVIRAARRPSPVTREALEVEIFEAEARYDDMQSIGKPPGSVVPSFERFLADALVTRFSLPEPAEDEDGGAPF